MKKVNESFGKIKFWFPMKKNSCLNRSRKAADFALQLKSTVKEPIPKRLLYQETSPPLVPIHTSDLRVKSRIPPPV